MKDWESTCQIKEFGYSAALGFILSSSPSTLMFYKGTGLVPEKILRPECSLSLDLSLPALHSPLFPSHFTQDFGNTYKVVSHPHVGAFVLPVLKSLLLTVFFPT